MKAALRRVKAWLDGSMSVGERIGYEPARVFMDVRALVEALDDRERRIRLARRYVRSVSTGDFVQGSLVLAASRALDLRRPKPRRGKRGGR